MEEKDRNMTSWWDTSSTLTVLQDCIGIDEKKNQPIHFTIKGHSGEFQLCPIMNTFVCSINTFVHTLHLWNGLGVDS